MLVLIWKLRVVAQLIKQLLIKAEELFIRYGVRSIAMDDLARELGVSKKTLYQQVANKKELIRQILERSTNQKKTEIAALRANADNAVAELVKVVQYMLVHLRRISPNFRYDIEKYYPSLHREMETFNKAFFEEFILGNLEWGVREGLYRSNVDPVVIARVFVNTAIQAGRRELFPLQEYELDKLLEQLFLYHIHGVATVKGTQYIRKYLGEEATESFTTS